MADGIIKDLVLGGARTDKSITCSLRGGVLYDSRRIGLETVDTITFINVRKGYFRSRGDIIGGTKAVA